MKSIPPTRSSMPSFEEYTNEIKDIWDSRWLTNMGAKHLELEHRVTEYLGVKNVTLFVNGHSALECILDALNLPKGSEVITSPFTFASTTHAIVRKGLTPVFCDIDPVTYTIDPTKIETLINEKTHAVLPIHVYGNLCDVDAIQSIADKHHLKVIYDAAHAFGVRKNGVGVGCFGDASMFSFHAVKVFHTIEGGAVAYKNDALKDTLNRWKNFGIAGPESVQCAGGNSKMNEFCAAMGICNLRHIDEDIRKRHVVHDIYDELLGGVEGLTICGKQEGVASNYAYYPVVFDPAVFGKNRNEVQEALQQRGIFTRKYFFPLTSMFECYRGVLSHGDTPVADHIAQNVLTLPMYSDLTEEDAKYICEAILQCR